MESMLSAITLRTDPSQITTRAHLRSGTAVTVRLLQPQDGDRLGDYFAGLSAETRRRFGPHPLDRPTAHQLCAALDPSTLLRVMATVDNANGAQPQVVAYVLLQLGLNANDEQRYAEINLPLDSSSDCTVAPSVADAYQSQGLGSVMMTYLIDVARRLGRKRVVLWGGVQATNDRAVHYYQKFGFVTVRTFEHPVGLHNYDMILTL